MKKLYVFGDSHVNVLSLGWHKVVRLDFPSLPFDIEFYARHGRNWFELETIEQAGGLRFYANRFPNFESVDYIVDYTINNTVCLYVFSSPLHSAVCCRNRAWQTFCPWKCVSAHPELQAVSSAVIETWAQAEMKRRFVMMRALKARGYKIAVIEPPKPFIRVSARYQIKPAVIIAVDQIYRDFVTSWMKQNDIPVLTVPEHSYSNGFTTPEYEAPNPADRHHGSQQFGVEMMRKIMQFASGILEEIPREIVSDASY